MAQTPARRTKKAAAKKKSTVAFEQVSEIDEDGNFTAKIFGEEFSLNANANGWLKMLAGTGKPSALIDLVESMINVEPEDGESVFLATERTRRRFHDTMTAQSDFGIEDAVEFIGDLMEVSAGNDLPE